MNKPKKKFKKGDTVSWNTSQGKTKGVVQKKVTSSQKVKKFTAKASSTNPEYEVKSSKTGKKAIHKPGQLKKIEK